MRAPRSSALTQERKSHEVKKKALLAVPGGVAIALLAAGPAFGQEFDPSKTTTDVYDQHWKAVIESPVRLVVPG